MTGLRPGQSGETVLTQAGDGVLAMRLNHAESAHAGNRVMRDEHPAVNHDGERSGVDLGAAERAAAEFLAGLRPFRLTTFPNDEGYDELVLARAIPFRTLCEHHMLLFSGVAHVGYLPGERILGLSKLARLVGHFAARPQTQERLTMQVAKCLDANLRPRGAGVVLEAGHTCMTQRGIRAHGATTVTSALLGTLRTDPRSRAEFFALARVPTSPEPM
jgi:GTP cyclohydrolase IA